MTPLELKVMSVALYDQAYSDGEPSVCPLDETKLMSLALVCPPGAVEPQFAQPRQAQEP